MYNLSYFIVKSFLEKRDSDPHFSAVLYISLCQWLLLFMIVGIFERIIDVKLFIHFSDSYVYNKIAVMPFLALWTYVLNKYYKNQAENINKKYASRNRYSKVNVLIVLSLLFIPVIGMFIMLVK